MDEKRLEAYFKLIQALLKNSTQEVDNIVNTNPDILDSGLVRLMAHTAERAAEQGNEKGSRLLQDWAAQLGSAIGYSPPTVTPQETFIFLTRVLTESLYSKGDPKVVYPLLEANLGKLNEDNFGLCIALILRGYRTGSPVRLQETAAAIGLFCKLILDFPLGSRASNLEMAIVGYQNALNVFTREAFPQAWAESQNNLGIAYKNRIGGKRAENIEQAIACYENALQVYTREAFPEKWAGIQQNLATAYNNCIRGERAENIEQAIACCEKALQVYTCEAFPQDWAEIQNNLGNAYSERIRGKRAENLEKAIACYENALQVDIREAFPEKWALFQYHLADAYRNRIRGVQAENLEQAIDCCEKALQVFTREAFPEKWATTQNSLANAYSDRIYGKQAENLEQAISCYQKALQVFTLEDFPRYWAMTQHNLGAVYEIRIRGDRAENLEQALACYENALQVYTRKAFPEEWAGTQNNLGLVYNNRVRGEQAENVERAIACYENALQVFTEKAFPDTWALTQRNLGTAYGIRTRGKRTENLEQAIVCAKNALSVFTQEASPREWAKTQNNLGITYQEARQFHNAYTAFAAAIDTVESLRGEIVSSDEAKQKLAEEWNKLYQDMVEVCLELGNYTAAIEYAERSKTRNLVEQILTRDLHNIFPPDVVTQLEQLRDEIASHQNQIQTGKADNPTALAQHLAQLRQQRNELQNRYLPIGSGFKFDYFQSTLDDHTAIIEWYITHERFQTFIVTRNSSQPFVLSATTDDRKALIDWANTYLKDYYGQKDNWRTQLTPRLKELAQILHLDEILAHLPKECQQLILIPHQFLHLFPLHALPIDELCLIDRFPKGVSYAPSCQLLLQAQKRQRPDFTHLFAIQNPTKDRPYVDFGIEAIRRYFHPNDYVLPGDKATKANLIQSEQLRSAHCFHFFGHATFNFQKSALILADGHLTLGEIFALDLNQCRLVILSACETGMTDFTSISDEYIGLPSGFLFAGSPSVVSTLWVVDQLSAAFLMIEFYENLRNYEQLEEGDIAIALNFAQKRLRDLTTDEFEKRLIKYKPLIDEILDQLPKIERRKAEASRKYRLSQAYPFAHPFDWAAFTATGI